MSAWPHDRQHNVLDAGADSATGSLQFRAENGHAPREAAAAAQPVQAGQIIYANVELKQSTRGEAGFQSLFVSPGVSKADDEEAPERLFYRARPDGPKPVKQVFYRARSGSLVVAQIVPLPDADGAHRRGLSFAHALVLAPDDFARLGSHAVPLLRRFPFMTTVDEALAAGDRVTGSIEPVILHAPPGGLVPDADALAHLDAIDPQQRRALLLLAAQIAASPESRNRLGLRGEQDEALRLVEALAGILPAPLRAGCSFDTFFTGGDIGLTPYWAVALSKDEVRHPRLYAFDLDEKRFAYPVEAAPQTPFESWLESNAWAPARTLAHRSEAAYQASRWFEGEGAAPATVDEDTFQEVAALCGDVLERRLLARLREQAGSLADRLAPEALRWAGNRSGEAAAACASGIPMEVLGEWAMRAASGSSPPLTPEEQRDVAAIAERAGHRLLRWTLLRRTAQWDQLAAELRRAEEDEFQRFARSALDGEAVQVEWMAQPDGSGCVLGTRVSGQGRGSDLPSLLRALLGVTAAPGGSGWFSREKLLSFSWRGRPNGTAPAAPAPAVPVARWLWLMKYLSQNTEGS